MNGKGGSSYLRCIVLVAMAPLFALLACGDGGPAEVLTPAPPVPASVTVVPSTATLAAIGQTLQLNTTVLDQNGQPIPGVSVTWISSDQSVAIVDANGLVTAMRNGVTLIAATVTGTSVSGRVDVTVEQQPREIVLSPEQESFHALGDTIRLTAQVLDANAYPVEDAVVDWVSSDASVVSVDDFGLVKATGHGTTSILATSGPALGSAHFSVEQLAVAVQLSSVPDTLRSLGNTFQLTARGLDANGHVTRSTAFAWTSADESVATVSSAGLVTAVANGTTDVTAAVKDGSASASVSVTVAQRARNVRIAEVVHTLNVGDHYQLSASAYDANRHLVADARFEWSSSDLSVATVDPGGLLSARHTGSAEITVAVVDSDATATITLRVTARPSERDILVDLYNATGGPNWEQNLYWLTDFPLSVWDGVGTDDREGLVVTGLYLRANNLTGETPRGLGGLANLESLDLAINNLTGSIPPELGNLVGLHSLALSSNDLTGPIPPELGKLAALKYLWLHFNDLTGPIPPELGKLANAEVLELFGNNLTGSIPLELGDLASMRILSLGANGLTGSIPLELVNLDRLESLRLTRNNLTGPIPPEIGNLNSLRSLDLSGNKLTGPIPPELGSLAMFGRRACYSLSASVGACEHATFDLSFNELTGPIPSELANLDSLESLHLAGNRLTGPIPPELSKLSNLTTLSLALNDLTGSIAPELGNLGSLTSIDLAVNDLTGSIPPELGNLGSLEYLGLQRNNLTGTLPPELGNLRQLKTLYVHENELSGRIPEEFINLQLDYFHWNDTQLCAPANEAFQAWLRNIPHHRGGATCSSTGGP